MKTFKLAFTARLTDTEAFVYASMNGKLYGDTIQADPNKPWGEYAEAIREAAYELGNDFYDAVTRYEKSHECDIQSDPLTALADVSDLMNAIVEDALASGGNAETDSRKRMLYEQERKPHLQCPPV